MMTHGDALKRILLFCYKYGKIKNVPENHSISVCLFNIARLLGCLRMLKLHEVAFLMCLKAMRSCQNLSRVCADSDF